MVGQHGTVVVGLHSTLAEAASLLLSHDRTSAVVADASGTMVGAVTENDMLNAYELGVPGSYTVEAWLSSECARVPTGSIRTLTVSPTTTLVEAAAHMKEQAEGEHACRHVIIRDRKGQLRGILSCLDVVRAMAGMVPDEHLGRRLGRATVHDVMKPRAGLPVCGEEATLMQALEKMLVFHQNCVLIANQKDSEVRGVVTTRDALRAFADHVPVATPCLRWLSAQHADVEPRIVGGDVPLAEAAARMAQGSLHHLVVVAPGTSIVMGVVSSSDVAHAVGGAAP